MNECIQMMSQCDTTSDLKINIGHEDLYFTDFVLYLEDYLMDERHTLG